MSPSGASAPPTRSTAACRRRPSCARASGSRGASPPSGRPGASSCRSCCSRRSTRASPTRAWSASGFVAVLAAIAAVALVIAAVAQRTAVVRLGRRSEQALFQLRARLIAHIHRISLADHNEERRGALVARVTSDIETLAQFFQWGGLAWLLDGPLMVMVGAVMLAYNWILALVAFAVAAPLALVLRVVQRHLVAAYDTARERNGEMLSAVTEVVSGAATMQAYDAGEPLGATAADAVEQRAGVADPGPGHRRLPVPVGRGVLGADDRRRDRRRRRPRPGQRADGRGDGRLRVPHVPLPRADRRVHRGARPDADRGRRPAPRARRARPARRAAAARPTRARCRPARSTSTCAR